MRLSLSLQTMLLVTSSDGGVLSAALWLLLLAPVVMLLGFSVSERVQRLKDDRTDEAMQSGSATSAHKCSRAV